MGKYRFIFQYILGVLWLITATLSLWHFLNSQLGAQEDEDLIAEIDAQE